MGECNCCKVKIENMMWNDLAAVKFSAGGYEALVIPSVGANVIELKDTVRGLSLLRMPPDAETFKSRPQVYGIPVLFPPNRIEDGMFTAAGKEYHFPINEIPRNNHIHGFLHTRPWKVAKAEAEGNTATVEMVFAGGADTDFFRYLPHEFECRLSYTLSGEGLEQKISVVNKSSEPMPLGVGFHTAFKVPFYPEGKEEDYLMRVSIGQKWELSDRMLPTGKLLQPDAEEETLRGEGMPPVGHVIDRMLYTAEPITVNGKAFHGAVIEDRAKRARLVYAVGKEYQHWMLWNMTGDLGFVCPEPQTMTVNAPNVKQPSGVTGFKTLPAGQTWEETARIYVEEL